jgi:hypothetical protein
MREMIKIVIECFPKFIVLPRITFFSSLGNLTFKTSTSFTGLENAVHLQIVGPSPIHGGDRLGIDHLWQYRHLPTLCKGCNTIEIQVVTETSCESFQSNLRDAAFASDLRLLV